MKYNFSTILFLFCIVNIFCQKEYLGLQHWEIPSKNPDRIVLTFHGDPSSSRAVTWRTDRTVNESVAQISEATENSNFTISLKDFQATTEAFDLGKYKGNNSFKVNYHSVIFKDLKPNTTYLYRVGDGKFYWSEWIQFTTAKKEYSNTKFVYFGDSQNNVLSQWSRVIRMANQTAPDATFAIHAGDLVNDAHKDSEWAEWYKAGGFIHSQWTTIPVLGNHEYWRLDEDETTRNVSIQWRPQFTLPVEKDLSKRLHETVYTTDYQDIRIIVLNSNFNLREQTKYVERKLKESTAKWNIITCHHSVFSPAKGRDFKFGREVWKPIFDKYNVDLVLNGHDHTYARGHIPEINETKKDADELKTVYITSVSGPKQYRQDSSNLTEYLLKNGYELDKAAQFIQFFQVITIDDNKLTYEAYTATGKEYDRFVIVKDHQTGTKRFSYN